MFEASQGSSSLEMSFCSTLEKVDQADREMTSFLSRMGLQAEAFGIRLAMREALLNSIKHGNSGESHKIVTCKLRLEDNHLVMEIEDEGPGFDWRVHMGKKAAVTSHCGRGLIIIKTYCEHLQYNAKGNRLVLTKKIRKRKLPTSEITKRGEQTIVRPAQDLVASIASEFKKKLLSLLEEGIRELVIDLTGVQMVDTDGLRALTEVRDCLGKTGGKLILTNVTEDIYGLLKAMQLDQIFTVVSA